MRSRTSLPLAALAVAVLAAPAGAAAATPATLPAVKKQLRSSATSSKPCAGATRARRGTDAVTYRAPISGFLNVTLKGRGDWDLIVTDTARRRVGASQGFGGSEIVQAWIGAGQRVVARGCRRQGAARRAAVRFRLVDVAPPKPVEGATALVRVRGTQEQLQGLERLGLDVTHAMGRDWADVVVGGAGQLELLKATGLAFEVREADLAATFRAARLADRRYAARAGAAGSPLPSGRTEYRTREDYETELKQLVERNPGLVRPVVLGRTFQGREISGVEIAHDVAADDGRPVHFLMGAHHAREWPSGEAVMEFARLLAAGRDDPRISALLDRGRMVLVPQINVDGFVSSRGAFDPGDSIFGQDPNVTLVEAVAPPGGLFAYRRKNCNGEIAGPEMPCELAWGVDPNRNYGNLWGGPGSSSDVTSQSYHGPSPRSEVEVRAVWDYARTHHVTSLVSVHNVAALVLRPPGLSDGGLSPDEQRMKEIGDAVGEAAGYTSQFGWQLYDTAGTTEDDTYAATGGYGYTIEMGPPDGQFHMPYETGVVAEWTGDNDHSRNAGGLREGLLLLAEAAVSERDHAVFEGGAPAGTVLRLQKSFKTATSPYCEKSVEPIVNVSGLEVPCLTGEKPPLELDDEIDTTTAVGPDGRFEWHVNQSTRPFVGGGAVKEQLTDVEPPVATFAGAPAEPTGTADHEFTLAADQVADKLRITLESTLPEDYDIEVFRREGDQLKPLGSSGNLPGESEEVILDRPAAGTYVVRVAYYAAATGSYEVEVVRAVAQRTVTSGRPEAYALTCERPDGTVLETRELIIARGERVAVNLGCGAGPTTTADGSPLPAGPITARTAPAGPRSGAPRGSRTRLRLGPVRLARRSVRARVICPFAADADCRGRLRALARKGKRSYGARRFTVERGETRTVRLRLNRAGRRALHSGRTVRLVATARAGDTRLKAAKRTLRRR